MIAAYARIAARSVGKGVLTAVVGVVVSVACFIIGTSLFSNNGNASHGGHAGGIAAVLVLFMMFVEEFWSAVLIWSSIPFLIYYLQLAMSTTLLTAVCGVWDQKLSDFTETTIAAYLTRMKSNQKDWMKTSGDAALLKARLMQQMKEDPSVNSVQRRVLRYAFAKLKLDDVDLSDPALDLPALVARRVNGLVSDAVRPEAWMLWVPVLVQVGIAIMAFIFDHH